MNAAELKIWTIGHSTRGADEFIELLIANEIEALADVRRFPASRKYPHFNAAELRGALEKAKIEYAAFPELGGRRRPREDSPNTVWRSLSFRGYADYMETTEFQNAIERLAVLARRRRTAIMCSEAVWWRCHRALIADYLKSRGARVFHIIGQAKPELHPYTSAARVVRGELSYSPLLAAND